MSIMSEPDISFTSSDVGIFISQPQNITFHGADGTIVGTLFLGPPMRFEGNVEESAKVLFDCVCNIGNK